MKLFSPNHPFGRLMNGLADQLILNTLFLLCSLPLITIGPSLNALYAMESRIVRDDDSKLVRAFFKEFINGFWSGLITTGVLLFLMAGAVFAFFTVPDLGQFEKVFLGIASFCISITACWLYPIMGRFSDKPWRLLKNSLLMALLYFPKTLLLLIISVVPIFLFLNLPPFLLSAYTGFLFFLCPSLVSLLHVRIVRSVLDKFGLTEDTKNETD